MPFLALDDNIRLNSEIWDSPIDIRRQLLDECPKNFNIIHVIKTLIMITINVKKPRIEISCRRKDGYINRPILAKNSPENNIRMGSISSKVR